MYQDLRYSFNKLAYRMNLWLFIDNKNVFKSILISVPVLSIQCSYNIAIESSTRFFDSFFKTRSKWKIKDSIERFGIENWITLWWIEDRYFNMRWWWSNVLSYEHWNNTFFFLNCNRFFNYNLLFRNQDTQFLLLSLFVTTYDWIWQFIFRLFIFNFRLMLRWHRRDLAI